MTSTWPWNAHTQCNARTQWNTHTHVYTHDMFTYNTHTWTLTKIKSWRSYSISLSLCLDNLKQKCTSDLQLNSTNDNCNADYMYVHVSCTYADVYRGQSSGSRHFPQWYLYFIWFCWATCLTHKLQELTCLRLEMQGCTSSHWACTWVLGLRSSCIHSKRFTH